MKEQKLYKLFSMSKDTDISLNVIASGLGKNRSQTFEFIINEYIREFDLGKLIEEAKTTEAKKVELFKQKIS